MTDRRMVITGLSALAAMGVASQAWAETKRPRRGRKPKVDPAVEAAAAMDPAAAAKLDAALAGAHRSADNKARDAARHPKETLAFFGLKPEMAALEIIPGGGWFTEILAPYLRDSGKLYVWAGDPNNPGQRGGFANLAGKFQKDKAVFDQVKFDGDWLAPAQRPAAGSLDMVVTFRNVHNLAWLKTADASFKAWADLLKPGGVLGVEDHRWPDGKPNTAKPETPFNAPDNGYISEADVIALATKAGFTLAAKSEINANPKDTKDHRQGVWALPPTLIGGDVEREKFVAIGESDRMTLKFVKPA
jgi:predicted methyltransferase